jgi:hypothetical protein
LEPYPSKERVGKHVTEQVPNTIPTGERASYADALRRNVEKSKTNNNDKNKQQ